MCFAFFGKFRTVENSKCEYIEILITITCAVRLKCVGWWLSLKILLHSQSHENDTTHREQYIDVWSSDYIHQSQYMCWFWTSKSGDKVHHFRKQSPAKILLVWIGWVFSDFRIKYSAVSHHRHRHLALFVRQIGRDCWSIFRSMSLSVSVNNAKYLCALTVFDYTLIAKLNVDDVWMSVGKCAWIINWWEIDLLTLKIRIQEFAAISFRKISK